MIKLNRTTEYGLMALRHISRKHLTDPSEVTSAREVADSYGLPFEITAKTLQRLKDTGLIQSAHGAKGGYTLLRPLEQVSFAEYLTLMEGPQSIVACGGEASHPTHPVSECEYGKRCEIKGLMNRLNFRLIEFLAGIQLSEIADDFSVPVSPVPERDHQKVVKRDQKMSQEMSQEMRKSET